MVGGHYIWVLKYSVHTFINSVCNICDSSLSSCSKHSGSISGSFELQMDSLVLPIDAWLSPLATALLFNPNGKGNIIKIFFNKSEI